MMIEDELALTGQNPLLLLVDTGLLSAKWYEEISNGDGVYNQ